MLKIEVEAPEKVGTDQNTVCFYGPAYVADKTGETSSSLIIGLGSWGEGLYYRGSLGWGAMEEGLLNQL